MITKVQINYLKPVNENSCKYMEITLSGIKFCKFFDLFDTKRLFLSLFKLKLLLLES